MTWHGLPPWSAKDKIANVAADMGDGRAARLARTAPISDESLTQFRAALGDAKRAYSARQMRPAHEITLVASVLDDACAPSLVKSYQCFRDRGTLATAADGPGSWVGVVDRRSDEQLLRTGAREASSAASGAMSNDQGGDQKQGTTANAMLPRHSVRNVNGVNLDKAGAHCKKPLLALGRCLRDRLDQYQTTAAAAGTRVSVPSLNDQHSVALLASLVGPPPLEA